MEKILIDETSIFQDPEEKLRNELYFRYAPIHAQVIEYKESLVAFWMHEEDYDLLTIEEAFFKSQTTQWYDLTSEKNKKLLRFDYPEHWEIMYSYWLAARAHYKMRYELQQKGVDYVLSSNK